MKGGFRSFSGDGSLTGYAGGLDRKSRLLELEGGGMSRLYVPVFPGQDSEK